MKRYAYDCPIERFLTSHSWECLRFLADGSVNDLDERDSRDARLSDSTRFHYKATNTFFPLLEPPLPLDRRFQPLTIPDLPPLTLVLGLVYRSLII
jgi:hypothetical protein